MILLDLMLTLFSRDRGKERNISIFIVCISRWFRSHYIIKSVCVVVKRDIQESDEEAVRVKEQSILELGGLLAKTGQAAGNRT